MNRRKRARGPFSTGSTGANSLLHRQAPRRCRQGDEALRLLEQLPVELVPVDHPLVRAAAEIKSAHAVSYADAFCVATAQRVNGTVLTNDREFQAVEHLINIRWLAG